MIELCVTPNLADVDGLYERLLSMHAGCSIDESLKRSAKLILILANHIGDSAVIEAAVELATRGDEAASQNFSSSD